MWPQIVHFSQRKQSDLDSPCLQVSVDACVRSTEFGKLSHVRKIIHSYIQNDKVRVSGGYMSVLVYNERSIKGRGGLVVESLTRDRGVEPHRRHYVVSLGKTRQFLFSAGSTQEDG